MMAINCLYSLQGNKPVVEIWMVWSWGWFAAVADCWWSGGCSGCLPFSSLVRFWLACPSPPWSAPGGLPSPPGIATCCCPSPPRLAVGFLAFSSWDGSGASGIQCHGFVGGVLVWVRESWCSPGGLVNGCCGEVEQVCAYPVLVECSWCGCAAVLACLPAMSSLGWAACELLAVTASVYLIRWALASTTDSIKLR
jgi:hypothetical protein